ncbi:MAG: energy transducer TonB, partial [Sphingomonas sp.]|nr:energy transducer TonB [Sphingomonas sp.]
SDAADAQSRRKPVARARAAVGATKPVPAKPAKTPAVAAAPIAPPVAAPTGTPPQPVGKVADWFPIDSYPPQARALGLEGRTAFALDIDALGRITQCRVIETSGSELLDSATCTQAIVNGRFRPGRNAAGQAVPRAWQSSMRWKLAENSEREE